MSLDLLQIMGERDNYYRFRRFMNEDLLPSEVNQIIKDLDAYYEGHPTVEEVVWDEFFDWFTLVQHPAYKTDKVNQYRRLCERIDDHVASNIAETIVEKLVQQSYCAQIADLTLRGAEGEEIDLTDVESLLSDFNEEVDRVSNLDSFVVTDDLEALVEDVVDGGYRWRLDFLNQSVGNIRSGKLMCLAARPNVGKTTFLASEATFVASQLPDDEVVLWFNNEEAGADVKFRVVQAALGWTADKIRKDPITAMTVYESVVGKKGKIVIVDKADLSTKDIEEFCRVYKPGLIIFDQLWKVHGYEKTASTDTARLGYIFQWARELAKKHAPVLTVHQVKTEGEGVKYLTASQLYLSGTVIQGEVDTLIMMGRTYTPGEEVERYINIVKNKGAYGPDVDAALREGQACVLIKPETAQYEEP